MEGSLRVVIQVLRLLRVEVAFPELREVAMGLVLVEILHLLIAAVRGWAVAPIQPQVPDSVWVAVADSMQRVDVRA